MSPSFLGSFASNWQTLFSRFQGDSPFGKLEAYIKLEQLGEGSYATVFKGYSKWVSVHLLLIAITLSPSSSKSYPLRYLKLALEAVEGEGVIGALERDTWPLLIMI